MKGLSSDKHLELPSSIACRPNSIDQKSGGRPVRRRSHDGRTCFYRPLCSPRPYSRGAFKPCERVALWGRGGPPLGGEVVVIGGAAIDLVATAPALPLAGETRRGRKFAEAFGGKGANQAVQVNLP
eukprot:GHVT01070870.1.p2 GENE.GHVT01070870.1~~GHVT01070870.1.p2  ORF type:complete len:126 (-),score=25.11 GHVT01070870.1:166-543(-)